MKKEHVWIQCEKAELYAEMYIPKAAPAPAVLICHGLNAQGFRGLRVYTQLAETACKQGFLAFVFGFRDVGESIGNFDYGIGEQEDVKCALNYLDSRPEVAQNSIFVVGHSLGGAVALHALQTEKRVKALALWSTPKNHDCNVRKFIKHPRGTRGLYAFLILSRIDKTFNISKLFKLEVYGVSLRPKSVREKLMKLDGRKAVSKLHMPLFIVIGASDDIVSTEEAQEIYRKANEPKTLIIVEGADHIYRGKEQELINKTIE